MWRLLSKANTELLRQEITVYYQSCADRSNKEWVLGAVYDDYIQSVFLFFASLYVPWHMCSRVSGAELYCMAKLFTNRRTAGCKTCSAFTAHFMVETTSSTSQPVNCKATYKIKLVLRNLLICFNERVRVLWLITYNFVVLSVLLLFYIGCFYIFTWLPFLCFQHICCYTV